MNILDNNFLDVCRNCIIKLIKMLKFLVIFVLPPNIVFLLLIIIRQESAEAALNVRYNISAMSPDSHFIIFWELDNIKS